MNLSKRIETHLSRIANDFDYAEYNPPDELICSCMWDVPKGWQPVGAVPQPTTRLGWFVHHLLHGLMMRYPLRSVLAYSLLNTKMKYLRN